MRVLVGCEFSGVVRDAFTKAGHFAVSCDLLPSDSPGGTHIQGDVLDVIRNGKWDLAIFHPPCTYLCSSGLWRNRYTPGRALETERALTFVRALLNAPIHRIALENPIGRIATAIRPADQIVQPWQFGHDASKQTCLWLKNLPKLKPTNIIPPGRIINGRKLWGNQTPTGQNKLGPSKDRWKLRSITYQGIADAMAAQWGCL